VDIPLLLAELQLRHCRFVGQLLFFYLCPWFEGRRIHTHTHKCTNYTPILASRSWATHGDSCEGGCTCAVYLCCVCVLLVWGHAMSWSLNCWPASECQACAHNAALYHFSTETGLICLCVYTNTAKHTPSKHIDKCELLSSDRNTCS